MKPTSVFDRRLFVACFAACAACSASTPVAPATSSAAPPPPAPPAASTPAAAVAPPPPPSATAVATAAPSASAAPVAPAAEAPLPKVRVENIGMHIGGGPNDAPTKDPIKRSVAPHFDAFKRCYAKVDDLKKGGDFGVDLLIDKEGGKPKKLSRVRTTLSGEGFRDCVVAVFQGIDFLKPKGGLTMVSYSLRFTP